MSTGKRYFNNWSGLQDLYEDFELKECSNLPLDHEVLFASYEGGGYDGDAVVLYKKWDMLFFVSASHCSCYGLEGQWNPDEVIVRQLLGMKPFLGNEDMHGREAIEAWDLIMKSLMENE